MSCSVIPKGSLKNIDNVVLQTDAYDCIVGNREVMQCTCMLLPPIWNTMLHHTARLFDNFRARLLLP